MDHTVLHSGKIGRQRAAPEEADARAADRYDAARRVGAIGGGEGLKLRLPSGLHGSDFRCRRWGDGFLALRRRAGRQQHGQGQQDRGQAIVHPCAADEAMAWGLLGKPCAMLGDLPAHLRWRRAAEDVTRRQRAAQGKHLVHVLVDARIEALQHRQRQFRQIDLM